MALTGGTGGTVGTRWTGDAYEILWLVVPPATFANCKLRLLLGRIMGGSGWARSQLR